MKKLLSLVFAFSLITSNLFGATLELDYMEYSSDALSQAAYVTNGGTPTQEIPTNPSFELWTAGDTQPPDGWTLLYGGTMNKESSLVKIGTYSAKYIKADAGVVTIAQSIHIAKGINYWKGKVVTFGIWIWASQANKALPVIDDGPTYTQGSTHPGDSAWHFMVVSHTVSSSATQVQLKIDNNGEATFYIDGAVAVEGTYPYDGFLSLGYLQCGSESTIKTQGSYSLKVVAAQTDSLNKTLTKTF